MTQPTDYGVDLATYVTPDGFIDLAPEMTEVTGRDLLIQSLVRRQFTVRGTCRDSPNDGIDLRTMISDGKTPQGIAKIAGTITAELARDQRVRVKTTDIQVAFDYATSKLTIVENIDSELGPFSLVLAVGAVSLDVIVRSR